MGATSKLSMNNLELNASCFKDHEGYTCDRHGSFRSDGSKYDLARALRHLLSSIPGSITKPFHLVPEAFIHLLDLVLSGENYNTRV